MPAHFVKCEAVSEERVTVSEANVANPLAAFRNVIRPCGGVAIAAYGPEARGIYNVRKQYVAYF